MFGVYILFVISFACIIHDANPQGLLDLLPVIFGFFENENSRSNVVNVKLYYESHCPYCQKLEENQFKGVIYELGPYLEINTYPYGNAKTIKRGDEVQFECQHGPSECYGNKLHACALKHIADHNMALLFNICMMKPYGNSLGSDDFSARSCAKKINLSRAYAPILSCAKGEEGSKLLAYYGQESAKVGYEFVPYVLINGEEWRGDNLSQDICAAFDDPPQPCLY